ncbi:DNA-packaging protein small subunit [Stenotrophomonas phage StenR_269]|nr:DNA-packaging protein small subunit [Stenotrophomonas phage StenR_269]
MDQPNKPTLQEQILELYSDGASDAEVAGSLNLPKARFYELYEENVSFKKIVDIGRTKAEAWWNAVGRRNLLTKGFQGPTWAFNMKNRWHWADKIDVGEKSGETSHTVEELERDIAKTMDNISRSAPHLHRKIMEGGDGSE